MTIVAGWLQKSRESVGLDHPLLTRCFRIHRQAASSRRDGGCAQRCGPPPPAITHLAAWTATSTTLQVQRHDLFVRMWLKWRGVYDRSRQYDATRLVLLRRAQDSVSLA